MTRHLSRLIAWGCAIFILIAITATSVFVFRIDAFADLTQQNLKMAIQWQTVTTGQWYGFLFLTAAYLAIGLVGLHFLRRAFSQFAKGEFFNQKNSRNLRVFSIFILIQAAIKPVHFALSSLLLSFNHPAGQKMLSISFGSAELTAIALAIIFLVVSDLLVIGSDLEAENKQFI